MSTKDNTIVLFGHTIYVLHIQMQNTKITPVGLLVKKGFNVSMF